ncbi:Outer membrane protein (Porin) [Gammaproteobacteria bacterium]
MNKKILTAAITAALVAPTAVLAEVTVYGQMHMSLDYTNSGRTAVTYVPGTKTAERKSNLDVSSNSSRLGFKGSEDLGSGLKAVWQVESTVAVDEATGAGNALGGRNTFLGLAGGFGTVLMGKHDTPFKMLGRSLDPFGDTIADNRQLLGNTSKYAGLSGVGFDLRAPNVVAYITPNFSGFGAVLAYVSGVTANTLGADENTLSAVSMNATYTNGPIYAGLAYERHGLKEVGTQTATVQAKDPTAWRLGGSYTFGPAKVGAMYEQLKNVNLAAATAAATDTKRTGATLFGTYSFGMETVKLAYTMANKWKVGGVEAPGSDASLLALGMDHNFSKRTTAYAQYTKLTNKDGTGVAKVGAAGYSLGGGGGYGDAITGVAGDDPSSISVGMIHKF